MEQKRVLKVFGNFFTADENELPCDMSPRTSRMTIRKQGSSVWSCNASRHCTNGRPAVSKDASCCVKMASSPNGRRYFLDFFSSDFCFAKACAALTLVAFFCVGERKG